MRDATLDLYKAVRAVLAGDAAVAADVPGSRIVSDWTTALQFPCIRIQIPNVVTFEADGGEGAEHTVHVHIYTQEDAPLAVARISANVVAALHDAEPALDDADLWWIQWTGTIPRKDPDTPNVQTARVAFIAVATDQTT